MKALTLAAGLILATSTSALASDMSPIPGVSYGVNAGSAATNALLEQCLSEDSSSRAIRSCTKLLRAAGPNETVRAQILARRGLHKMAMGRFEEATTDFTRSGDLADHEGLATLGQGFAAMLDNDIVTAKAKFEDCNNAGEIAPLAEYGLGMTYQMSGDQDRARLAFERALELRPGWDAAEEQMALLD